MTVRDPEVLELLRDDPELLAIADAIASTQAPATRPRRRAPLLAVAAAVAALIALALFAPWRGDSPGILDRALAAVGDGPVLHVVTQSASENMLVEISTGRAVPRVVETELWLDRARGLERSVTRIDGVVTEEVLQTPQGTTSREGIVYTCAWIAAHPVQATKERVSCNLSGENGTTPRKVPEAPPTVDPALGGFVDRYRAALADGSARQAGEGTVKGVPVYWLRIETSGSPEPPGGGPAPRSAELVAIDRDTYRPLLIRRLVEGARPGSDDEVVRIETLPRGTVEFSEPRLRPYVRGINVRRTTDVSAAEARGVLPAAALWAGPRIAGLELSSISLEELSIGYQDGSGQRQREDGRALELAYGGVRIVEADASGWSRSWASPVPPPRAGLLELRSGVVYGVNPNGGTEAVRTGRSWTAFLQQEGLYIGIHAPTREAVLEVARALEPIPAGER